MIKRIFFVLIVFLIAAMSPTVYAQTEDLNYTETENKAVNGNAGIQYDFSDYQTKVCGGQSHEGDEIQSDSNDLQISLNDVYISNGLLYFSINMGTSGSTGDSLRSTSNYYNGESRSSGTWVSGGDNYIKTMNFIYCVPAFTKGIQWETFRLTFNHIFFTLVNQGLNDCQIQALNTNEYKWSFSYVNNASTVMIKNPSATVMDDGTIQITGDPYKNQTDMSFESLSLTDGTLQFDLVQKWTPNVFPSLSATGSESFKPNSNKDNDYSVSDKNMPEQPEDKEIRNSSHFSYTGLSLADNYQITRFGIWSSDLSFAVDYYDPQGVLQTWNSNIPEDSQAPFQIVDFVQIQ